uniref:Uncharacterized protein n=1 Tax=Setaria viridis TaxID=4556 RepID=A0A4U6VT05_SETVI|nr:hypothetical protein SEVIR_2G205350v2 [Setaria viridis]
MPGQGGKGSTHRSPAGRRETKSRQGIESEGGGNNQRPKGRRPLPFLRKQKPESFRPEINRGDRAATSQVLQLGRPLSRQTARGQENPACSPTTTARFLDDQHLPSPSLSSSIAHTTRQARLGRNRFDLAERREARQIPFEGGRFSSEGGRIADRERTMGGREAILGSRAGELALEDRKSCAPGGRDLLK